MTRLLLAWIGVAALQLGMPSAADAAELLRRGSEPASVAPRPDAQSKGALTPHGRGNDAVQVAQVTPGAPADPPHPLRASTRTASPAEAPRHSAPASPARVLPDARAPPA